MLSMLKLLYLPLIAANNNGLVEPDGTVVMEVDTDGSPMYHAAPGMTMRDLELALGITQEDWQHSSVASDALEVDGTDADGTHHIHETHAEINHSPKFNTPLDIDKEDWQLVIDPSKNAVPLGNEKEDFFYSIPYPGPWPPAENWEEAAAAKKAAAEAADWSDAGALLSSAIEAPSAGTVEDDEATSMLAAGHSLAEGGGRQRSLRGGVSSPLGSVRLERMVPSSKADPLTARLVIPEALPRSPRQIGQLAALSSHRKTQDS